MNEVTKQRLLEFLKATFDYDKTLYLLAVSATEADRAKKSSKTLWKVRVALTYREGDSINPYFDGTDLEVAVDEMGIRLVDEISLANDPPIVEGSPNALAVNWVSVLAFPFWISEEAQTASAAGMKKASTKESMLEAERPQEDPFADYFRK